MQVKLLNADGAEIPSIAAESILTDFTIYSLQNTSVLTVYF